MAPGVGSRASLGRLVGNWRELILPLAIVASVLVIVVPLPAALMDILLAANITVAVIVLLTTIYVRTPLEFSIFPALLLATTLARLVLNVATTRLILSRAEIDGLDAAGRVVNSFADFVAGDGKIVVGLVIFAIIVVIQFVVITKGATRISEVAARFALDGMPGRQMAIDADLSAGAIDEKEARRRRDELGQQADFFGAMDGASKFVRGDAIAGIVITLVNVVGGLAIGVFQAGMSMGDATSLFTRLTIGDGLVSQIPAFLIAVAAGLLVTRSTQSQNLPAAFLEQLFSRPQALVIAGGFLCILIFTSLPAVPLMMIGGSCIGLAALLVRREGERAEKTAADARRDVKKRNEKPVEDYLAVDPMEIELGVGLLRLADSSRGGDLLERIARARNDLAAELGIVLPKVRVRDNLRLGQSEYRVKIADVPVAEGTIPPENGEGIDHSSQAAEMLARRLVEIARRHADELLTRDATRGLIDLLKKTSPTVVEELVPKQMSLAEVQQVLQILLRDGMPIRQLGVIFETLGDCAATVKDQNERAERVRRRLARTRPVALNI